MLYVTLYQGGYRLQLSNAALAAYRTTANVLIVALLPLTRPDPAAHSE